MSIEIRSGHGYNDPSFPKKGVQSIMKTIKVNLNSIEKVKKFVNIIALYDNDFDLVAGRYVIDAKSIMGIFSLDLSQDLDLVIQHENDLDKILEDLKEFTV